MNRSQSFSLRDGAFRSYAAMKKGKMSEAESFIRESVVRAVSEGSSVLDASYWLWIAGEHANLSGSSGVLKEIQTHARQAVQLIMEQWETPIRHWLGLAGEPEAIYLSNLAIMYGAVLAVQPSWSEAAAEGGISAADLQKLLKAMRELLFAKMIKDGRVVSRLGSRAINGDIVLAAVPFGMLGIEDRILIEALFVVEENLMGQGVCYSADDIAYGGCERPDLACLLAWYYTEKGDLGKAKLLLKRASELKDAAGGEMPEVDEGTVSEPFYLERDKKLSGGAIPQSPLASALYDIAETVLAAALEGDRSDASEAIVMKHVPTGTDDPYVYAPHERSPRYPEEGELVFVRMMTLPFRPASQQVRVEYTVNGESWNTAACSLATMQDGEQVWEAALGRFAFGEQVSYRFIVEEEGGSTGSDAFHFRVRGWRSAGEPVAASQDDHEIFMQFAASEVLKGAPAIRFSQGQGYSLDMRLEWTEGNSGCKDFPESWNGQNQSFSLALDSCSLNLHISEAGMIWDVRDAAASVIARSARGAGLSAIELLCDGSGQAYSCRLNMELQDGEKVYGMGERYASMEYRGCIVDNHVYNEYRSQGLKTYMPVPFYMSSSGYGLFLDTTRYSRFDFGSGRSDVLAVEADIGSGQELRMCLFLGHPLSLIRQLTSVTAKPVLPPKWSFGPWMSSNNWDSQAEVMKQVELTNRYEIPSTVIVLEQWSDEATFYIFNDAQYKAVEGSLALRYDDFTYPEWGRWPDPRQMVTDLHENGLKVLLWQIPIQKYMYGITHEQKDNDETFMLEQGYHIRHTDGTPYRIPYNWFKDCLVIDFTHEKGREWWFSKRRYLMEEVGIDGFKTDGGECILGHDLAFADGTPGPDMHNRYPLDYIGSYYRFVQEETDGDGLTFSRSGYSGAQRYPMHWAGDERSTYEAFRASILAGLTSGMSGIPFWGWDLGGFHGDIPTAELFVRATQMAAFCPVMQYHAETKGEFNQDRTPWNIAERTGKPEVIGLYKRFADIRMNILPYVYAEAIHSSITGEPMMRAMAVEFPEDKAAAGLTAQYMFGGSLLVAPVAEEGHFEKRVYFPQGQWMSMFGNEQYDGGRLVTVAADLEQIPVFIRQDSVIPLNLGKDLKLASHVGNRVDSYQCLAFMMFLVNRMDYHFEDDLGIHVTVNGSRIGNTVEMQVVSNAENGIHWIARGLDSLKSAKVNGRPLEAALTLDNLDANQYGTRDGDLILFFPSGEYQVEIEFEEEDAVC
ncbi:glycoside hydrolase family 31 protein [Paenibacillus chibensis]|uniref:Glycoside hydrolase family 31 protein n=1 Tax=Paenibacillus chibensis TaxID=59846 RepID=A0ABU6PX93_9BACL|nr:glycoside hydrolase family 31 protein [Paenibacillus chibensis]